MARARVAALLGLLIAAVPDVMAENVLIYPDGTSLTIPDRASDTDLVPTRLTPHWTKPRRAPLLGKAEAAERTHAEESSTDYAQTGREDGSAEQPSMIDVVGAGMFISPISDENHRSVTEEMPASNKVLPEAVKSTQQKRDWTTAARIVVHSPDKTDRLPSKLNKLLLDSGATSVENYEVELAVTRDHIRFYHPSDHMYAIEVAAALDGVLDTLLVKDFSFMRPQPPKGLVEIWLR